MRRFALLIGNNSGLPGVNVDIVNIYNYLTSPIGGGWDKCEISVLMNDKKAKLEGHIQSIIMNPYDYLFIYYSGHGGRKMGWLNLELNNYGELISIKNLQNLAPRQLNIFDCCQRTIDTQVTTLSDSFETKSHDLLPYYREAFNNRISKALEQQVNLFSCDNGQYSYDTIDGGVYTKSLLSAVYQSRDYEILALGAHITAAVYVYNTQFDQKPTYSAPKLEKDEQLIIGINLRNFKKLGFK